MAKKLNQEEVAEIVSNMYNNEYELVSKYTLSKEPIKLLHKKCNKTYEVKRAKDFLKENKCTCPYCRVIKVHSTKKLTEEIVIQRIKEQTSDEYKYISGFKNSSTKMTLLHKDCNKKFKVTPHMFLGNKQTRCPYCSNLKRGSYALKQNYLNELLNNRDDGNEYSWKEEYKNNNKLKHSIYHKLCKNTFEIRPNDFQQGYGCPYCNANSSKEEKKIFNFIKQNIDYKVKNNFRIDNKEIDIYIPELKIGFEFNGSYWHSTKFKEKDYHLEKKNFFKELGINIYFIDEIDWLNKKSLIKNKILYLIKSSNATRIYARKTKVIFNVNNDLKKKFLNKYHIQGNCNDLFNIGLVYDKKLVSLITFGCNRVSLNNKNKKLELIRYVTNNHYIVVGGFSKLLKHSIEYIRENYPEFDTIWTFADLSWSNGDLYFNNDFKLDHQSKPSYYFVYKNKKMNRYSLRKSELKKKFPKYHSEDLTESQITESIPNLLKIYNCGNLVFKKSISPSK